MDNEEERMRDFKTKNNLNYYCRTSCKTFEGIEDMFINLIDIYLKNNNNTLQRKEKAKSTEKIKILKKAKKKDCNIL